MSMQAKPFRSCSPPSMTKTTYRAHSPFRHHKRRTESSRHKRTNNNTTGITDLATYEVNTSGVEGLCQIEVTFTSGDAEPIKNQSSIYVLDKNKSAIPDVPIATIDLNGALGRYLSNTTDFHHPNTHRPDRTRQPSGLERQTRYPLRRSRHMG